MNRPSTPYPRRPQQICFLKYLLLLLLLVPLSAGAQSLQQKYTARRPLIIVGDWDTPPFTFNNIQGQADGYCIDVLEAVLNQLNIPHTFMLMERSYALRMYMNKDVDAIIDPTVETMGESYRSESVLGYYKIQIASNKRTPPITKLDQLKQAEMVVVKSGDDVSQDVLSHLLPDLKVEEHSPRDALAGLANGKYTYFIWVGEALKNEVKRLGLSHLLTVNDVPLSTGHLHLTCYDKALLEQIDDQIVRMELNGSLEQLRKKRFSDQSSDNYLVYWVLAFIVIALAVSVVFGVFNRLAHRRVKQKADRLNLLGDILHQALSISAYSVVEYDVSRDRFTNSYGHVLPDEGFTMEQLLEGIDENKRATARIDMQSLLDGYEGTLDLMNRWNFGTPDHPCWVDVHGYAVAEITPGKGTTKIISTMQNLSSIQEEEHREQELINKYIMMFDRLLIPMSFYDKDGRLVDANAKMIELCEINNETRRNYFWETLLQDTHLIVDDFDHNSPEIFHTCQHMYYPELNIDKYIEVRLQPVFDDNGELAYHTVTALDVTAERELYLSKKAYDDHLHAAADRLAESEQRMYYLLKSCNMYFFETDNEKQTISFARKLNNPEYTITYQQYVKSVVEDERQKIVDFLSDMNNRVKSFNILHHFYYTPNSPEESWYILSGTPSYDQDGRVKGYFGVARNVTELMEAQQQLRIETARAENSGMRKSAFLANMTHEIRTPLNAIVGFSDLMQFVEDPADREEFIRIILNNCDMLLRLINDILEASNADAGQLRINPVDLDFAQAFDDICQTLAQRVQNPEVAFIADNPYKHYRTRLDKARIHQVCTNFVTNAVKYTQKGHIKMGYREQDGGLYIYCEDTGAGIAKDKQSSVFDRFVKLNDYVQGTGLGLNICRSIAELCGGRIGVESEGEGHGCTFWIWIPCRRRE